MAFEMENGVLKKYTEEPGVTEVLIPEGVTDIEAHAFQWCNHLTQITISDSVKSIGDAAFRGCHSLTEITIPDSVTSIGDEAFQWCDSLTQITIPDGVQSIGDGVFGDCRSLTQITMPESVTCIGGSAFSCCFRLNRITIPAGVKNIGSWVFNSCPLTEITIPAGVESIEERIFFGCKKLQVIRLRPDDPAIFRDYSAVKDLSESIRTAWEMLRTGDYAVKLDHNVKYPVLILHYLHTKDEELGAYIKKNITKLMKAAITNDDLPFIQAVTQVDTFITKKSIDKFIQQALDEHQQRIWAYLADYKNRHFGFAPKNDDFL